MKDDSIDIDPQADVLSALFFAQGGKAPSDLSYPDDLTSYEHHDKTPVRTTPAYVRSHILGPLTDARIEHYIREGRYGPELQAQALERDRQRRTKRDRKAQIQREIQRLTDQFTQSMWAD